MSTEQNAMQPSGDNVSETRQQQGQPAPFQPLREEKKTHNWGKIIAIVFGILVLVAMTLVFVAAGFVQNGGEARNRAENAAIRSLANGALPAVVLCSDNPNNVVLDPRDDGVLCQGDEFQASWPNIGEYGGFWGGCNFFVQSDPKDRTLRLQYCATMKNGDLVRCAYSSDTTGLSGCEVL